MEELRSTEVLDKEIREDARKKAEKILSQAEEKSKEILSSVSSRVAEERAKAEKTLKEKLLTQEKKSNASLPLEKQRYLVTYINDSMLEAINSYLDSIGEDRRLSVIESMLKAAQTELGDKRFKAYVSGISLKKAGDMLKTVLKASLVSCEEADESFNAEYVPLLKFHEGVFLVSEDSSVTCRFTLDEKVKDVLDKNSRELSFALFGGRLPE